MGLWDIIWNQINPVPAGSNLAPATIPVTLNFDQLEERMFALQARASMEMYGMSTIPELRRAFRKCSPLAAIVAQKAYAFAKGTVRVWNPESEKKVRGQYREWEALFRNPNKMQSSREFLIQAYSYVQRFGYCVIDPEYPAGFNDIPSALRVLPNWLIDWEFSQGVYNTRPQAAWFNVNGRREPLDVNRLVIIRDTVSVDFDSSTGLPYSRASVLVSEVSNVIAALNARGQMITDRGANGLISNSSRDAIGSIPVEPGEKDRLQNEYRRYGNMQGQDKVIITDANLSYTPMTFDVDELGLHPEHIANIKAMCNTYSFPFTMLAEGFEGKYNNSTDSRRDFQDTTIDPESMDFFEQLSRGLGMYQQKCEAYIDYTGVASVQASQKEKGDGLRAMNAGLAIAWTNGLITRNEWREALGMDKIAGNPEEFDKYKFETATAIAEQQLQQHQYEANQTANGQGNQTGD